MLKCRSHFPKLFLRCNKIKYGEGLKLIGWPFLFRYPEAAICLGEKVTINSSFFSNLIGLYQRTIIVARGKGRISVGSRVGISGATIYARDSIVIGDDTLIGANTKIFDNDFHPIDSQERLTGDLGNLSTAGVVIGKNVFVGCNCIILKGSYIGDNCVVGAGSVVCGKFPNNTVIAGNPAKIIKSLEGDKETTV